MIENLLINIIYAYYPKGICSYTEKDKYIKSCQYKYLTKALNNYIENPQNNSTVNLLISELREHEYIKEINDFSLLDWQYRCLTFEIKMIINNEIFVVFLNLSVLIPYFCIIAKDEFGSSKILSIDSIDNNYTDCIEFIYSTTEQITKFSVFPKEIANKVIPDLSFGEVELNNFTIYNAFFLDS